MFLVKCFTSITVLVLTLEIVVTVTLYVDKVLAFDIVSLSVYYYYYSCITVCLSVFKQFSWHYKFTSLSTV